jgi:glycogen(starch) synthase
MTKSDALCLLTVCNRYPPTDAGGYPQLCYDVVNRLRARGHQVTVLTTVPKKPLGNGTDADIVRTLLPEVEFGNRTPAFVQQLTLRMRNRRNRQAFSRVLECIRPDLVFFWPSESMTKSLFVLAERDPELATAYYLAGYSPLEPSALERYWQTTAKTWIKRWPKALVRRIFAAAETGRSTSTPLQLAHVMCVSDHERLRAIATGIDPRHAVVVHNGIDLAQFPFMGLPSTRRSLGEPLRVLYAGRICWEKGVHTAIEGVDEIVTRRRSDRVHLTILGAGPESFRRSLRYMVERQRLSAFVTFTDWMPRPTVAAYMAQFDALVLPTIHDEPLARVVQEAMALGLVVIGTPTGGTPEVLSDGETGLIFPPQDASALANCLQRIERDWALSDRLAISARGRIETAFTIDHTVRRIEDLLLRWVHNLKTGEPI